MFELNDPHFVKYDKVISRITSYIIASLGKKHLVATLDRLYIKIKDMLQLPSQGNNFEDLELQPSWMELEQHVPIATTESQAINIDSNLLADAASFTPKR
ncbi:hypothetical protein RclHR1_10630007 [Rhizophagus clarus]|uniref:Uncharacterized protein n=1 Tax=Rhizophagus clarus TaxID=94130 RepID=A0A2Z6QE43_9GLOM|nr:hypothetical protein RclHR1_10630007 [Rhizophagus clarus]GES75211.1 hypothetical protein RCL_jg13267.t1 [Rhizophagus clarus]